MRQTKLIARSLAVGGAALEENCGVITAKSGFSDCQKWTTKHRQVDKRYKNIKTIYLKSILNNLVDIFRLYIVFLRRVLKIFKKRSILKNLFNYFTKLIKLFINIDFYNSLFATLL